MSLKSRIRARLARAGDQDRGSSVFEFILLVPVLIVLTLLVVQFALVWHGKQVAQAAAAEGVTAASGWQRTASDGAAEAERFLQQVAPQLLSDRSVTASDGGGSVTITVTAHVSTVVPFADFTIVESASGPVEQFEVTP